MEIDSSSNILSHEQASKDKPLIAVSPKTNLSSFHLFPLLPTELRCQIWAYALSWPRNLFIQKSHTIKPISHLSHRPIFQTRSANPPALLHVCPESRLLAQQVYQAHFGYQTLPRSWSGIWIAPAFDIIEFDSRDFSELLRHETLLLDLRCIQKLVLRAVAYRTDFLSTHLPALNAMPDLRVLELVIWRDSSYGFDTFVKVILDLVRQVEQLPMLMWKRNMPVLRVLDWGNGGLTTLRRRPDGSMEVSNDGI